MSTTDRSRTGTDGRPPDDVFVGADSSPGWVMFCASMIGLLAVMNFIYGVAAVSESSFFVGQTEFVLGGLNAWGWVLILVAAAQLLTAFGVAAQMPGVRWVGVAVIAVNAIVQLLVLPAYPWWATMLFTLDILVIYGLVAHGARND